MMTIVWKRYRFGYESGPLIRIGIRQINLDLQTCLSHTVLYSTVQYRCLHVREDIKLNLEPLVIINMNTISCFIRTSLCQHGLLSTITYPPTTVGWSDLGRKKRPFGKLCKIVLGPQFQSFTLKYCFLTRRRTVDCYP